MGKFAGQGGAAEQAHQGAFFIGEIDGFQVDWQAESGIFDRA
jgi:hypothetical protein